jgi:glycosyltransferase involved in cell wall biosynthesis
MKLAGWLVFYLRTDGMPNQKIDGVQAVEWVGNESEISEFNHDFFARALLELEQSICPDVIQIGPLVPTAAVLSEDLQTPVLGVSWSRDLLYDLDKSSWSTKTAINAIKRSHHLLVDCQTVANRAISLGANGKKVSVIPWGVDLDAFKFGSNADVRVNGRNSKDFRVISIRALEPLYRVSDLVESVKVLKSRSSLPNLRVSIFNQGSEEANLRAQVDNFDLKQNFEFSGFLPESDLPTVLSKFDAYVSTSPVDGSSISMLQAMATGIPCVVPDIRSNQEWIQDGLTGFVFESGNSADLAKVLEEVSQRPALVMSIVENARAAVEKGADWKIGSQKWLRILDALASQR